MAGVGRKEELLHTCQSRKKAQARNYSTVQKSEISKLNVAICDRIDQCRKLNTINLVITIQ